ncbi:BrnA antitoxin family protein [Streptomyces meridianus]|uniref:BrnA antitoxin family protein n=1 Tax=Streptomyces meridianus TaxID=2938945 RepID=A0ABT0X2U2_9ACTN|nr:BrnA antitoxin family protein [Streptomyces meridianus]MCM2576853.1 BrnA antitoxin family protein [Streptomyces meridianus]
MGSEVLSLRLDGELLDRIRQHAARRGMTVQDYVVRLLVRDDFDERFQASVDATAELGTWGLPQAAAPAGDGARLPQAAAPPGW